MRRRGISQYFLRGHKPQQQQQGSNAYLFFIGNNENVINNGAVLLEERISLFDGRTNPIRCFSVDDLNSMNVNKDRIFLDGFHNSYAGIWDMNSVMVKIFRDDESSKLLACREIAVATQMGTHRNVHRLLGCCLETSCPVLVYEWPENGTLSRRVFSYNEQSKEAVEWKAEWKERLKIGWEIARAVAYLHTAFRRPIIHRNLKPAVVFFDQEGSARLSDFSLCISIPEGEEHVEDDVKGTLGYVAPDYATSGKVSESSDVFAFGVLLLVLLTGKFAFSTSESDCAQVSLLVWVSECRIACCLADILDPVITRHKSVADDFIENYLETLVELAFRCSAEEKVCRPTMVEVATELGNMIKSSTDSF